MTDDTPAALGALRVDEGKLRNHVDEVVRSSVEERLNGLLDAEADQICRAQRYERSPERVDSRAGHYERKLETKAGGFFAEGERKQVVNGVASLIVGG
jgi:putative transposase